jgi:hypothetical protein
MSGSPAEDPQEALSRLVWVYAETDACRTYPHDFCLT